MKVITAPENYVRQPDDVTCFLAGGISNCPNWQEEVISILERENLEHLIIFNPRRSALPGNSWEQIVWEYDMIEECDIFSMYFCSGESVQPICLYELGKEIGRYGYDKSKRIIISCEKGYKRKIDVLYQCKAAMFDINNHPIDMDATPKAHARRIAEAYDDIIKFDVMHGEE